MVNLLTIVLCREDFVIIEHANAKSFLDTLMSNLMSLH